MTETSRNGQQATAFEFRQAGPRGSAARYLHPAAEALFPTIRPGMRVLDVGCGNGYWAGWFLNQGCQVVGIDPSDSGVTLARTAHPSGRFEQAVVSTDTLQQLGEAPFDLVISFEVVEHVYSPKTWAIGCLSALKPGGTLVCSTPYHGYLKNVLIALTGKWDHHHQPMHEGGAHQVLELRDPQQTTDTSRVRAISLPRRGTPAGVVEVDGPGRSSSRGITH